MELYESILSNILAQEKMHVTFPDLTVNVTELIDLESYRALDKIRAAIENYSLDDFMCIEEIMDILENIGSGGGNRHDFG